MNKKFKVCRTVTLDKSIICPECKNKTRRLNAVGDRDPRYARVMCPECFEKKQDENGMITVTCLRCQMSRKYNYSCPQCKRETKSLFEVDEMIGK